MGGTGEDAEGRLIPWRVDREFRAGGGAGHPPPHEGHAAREAQGRGRPRGRKGLLFRALPLRLVRGPRPEVRRSVCGEETP